MMTMTIQQAQSTLAELIHHLSLGDEVVITDNDHPVARLVPTPEKPQKSARRLGTLKGSVLYMAHDLDAPSENF